MARFEPISTYILLSILNNNDSLTIGITFIGEKNGKSK
jgi:hypothetical protein